MQREGKIARAAITEHSKLSQQSVHRVIDGLESRGFLSYSAAINKARGKPSPMVEIAANGYATLGISFTTENVVVCFMNLKGEILAQYDLGTNPNAPRDVLLALQNSIEAERNNALRHRQLLGVGIAMQGIRSGSDNKFRPPEPLAAWSDIPLATLFEDRLGLPAFAENNATASATAEHFLGGGRDHVCFAYLSFNYGFGVGLFWNHQPIQGGFGNAGEISSIYSQEQAVHRPALGELVKRLSRHDLRIQGINDIPFDATNVNSIVKSWSEETGPYLRQSLISIKGVLDPTAIFFGGQAPSALRKLLIAEGHAAFTNQTSRCPVLIESRLEGDAAHLGAAFLPLHNLVF
ncbi:NagC family transcriptional regulator [Pseudovibrio japonicus]|uniref:NagC family transcriptional regulator n=1 Tax=Pseudovibrio japonicus TaxID=366534 RepID=A0ABQ3EK66_9HYPH|nr:NagC family transcriptional regulator [Pseudovibrio japonicus]